MNSLELYIHIPFCIKKCSYCDFLSFPASEEVKAAYVGTLCAEILNAKKEYGEFDIASIYMGGGTPSVLSCAQILQIGNALNKAFDLKGLKGKRRTPFRKSEKEPEIEFTAEANPGTLSKEKLKAFKEAGANRISLGLQSTDNRELKELGRIHTYEDFLESFWLAREAGFKNINIDLMEAVPLQSLASFRKTLANVIALRPEHVSAYSLIIEEGTPFYERMNGNFPLALPGEDEEREIYYAAGELLGKAGYLQYEISNYALAGRQCRHNVGYWRRENYLGLGLGASSMVNNVRWKNTSKMETYLKEGFVKEEVQALTVKDQMEEFMFLGLRLSEGISKARFFESFKTDFDFIYGAKVHELEISGLVETEGDRMRLTKRGADVSNRVLAEFLL